MTPYIYQRGETISLALDAVSGDPSSVTAITAHLKAVPAGRTMVPAGAPVVATFSATNRAATGDIPPGWIITISAATSATLDAGLYQADARLVIAAGVIITDAVSIRIRDAVTT